MGFDASSLLKTVGAFAATVGACSVYANFASYYGTKYKLNRIAKRYGQNYAENVFAKEFEVYKSPTTYLFGGIGFKILKKKYKF